MDEQQKPEAPGVEPILSDKEKRRLQAEAVQKYEKYATENFPAFCRPVLICAFMDSYDKLVIDISSTLPEWHRNMLMKHIIAADAMQTKPFQKRSY